MSGWVWFGVAMAGASVFLYGIITLLARRETLDDLIDLGDDE
jgi:heme exporter protein D